MRRYSFIAFAFYFSLLLLVPATHCHASEEFSGHINCAAGLGPEHLPIHSGNLCCMLHEHNQAGGDDEHHIHFLIDDAGIAAARYRSADSSFSPQIVTEVVVESLYHPLDQGFVIVLPSENFYVEAFLPFFPGLSPPLS